MGKSLEECKGQNLHHMLTESPWEYTELFKKILNRSISLLRRQKEKIYLLVDEVGFRKKGKHSACVGHQYLGCIVKNDNGQVAVACDDECEACMLTVFRCCNGNSCRSS